MPATKGHKVYDFYYLFKAGVPASTARAVGVGSLFFKNLPALCSGGRRTPTVQAVGKSAS